MPVMMMVNTGLRTACRSRAAVFFMPVLRRLGLHSNMGDAVPLHGGFYCPCNPVSLGNL